MTWRSNGSLSGLLRTSERAGRRLSQLRTLISGLVSSAVSEAFSLAELSRSHPTDADLNLTRSAPNRRSDRPGPCPDRRGGLQSDGLACEEPVSDARADYRCQACRWDPHRWWQCDGMMRYSGADLFQCDKCGRIAVPWY